MRGSAFGHKLTIATHFVEPNFLFRWPEFEAKFGRLGKSIETVRFH